MESRIPWLDELTLQARVLVPILAELRKEIGNERAIGIVGTAFRRHYRKEWAAKAATVEGSPLEKFKAVLAMMRPRLNGLLDVEILKNDEAERIIKVTRCEFAELFKRLGEPELGKLMACELDFDLAEIAGESLEFRRTCTLMEGADHCDGHYLFKTSSPCRIGSHS
jgi:hypothetical protein